MSKILHDEILKYNCNSTHNLCSQSFIHSVEPILREFNMPENEEEFEEILE